MEYKKYNPVTALKNLFFTEQIVKEMKPNNYVRYISAKENLKHLKKQFDRKMERTK